MKYWEIIWNQFKKKKIGCIALAVLVLFVLVGIYAPIFASSKPFFVIYDGKWHFPFFKYMFFRGFYTKRLDIFYNLLMFTLPLFLFTLFFLKRVRKFTFGLVFVLHISLFLYLIFSFSKDPASEPKLTLERQKNISKGSGFAFDMRYTSDYAKLNMLLKDKQLKEQHERLTKFLPKYVEVANEKVMPTPLQLKKDNEFGKKYFEDKNRWIEEESKKLTFILMPLIRPFHWEDDAGGSQQINRSVSGLELTRVNRKDFAASLLFGMRVSLTVGAIAVLIALLIGIPIGSLAGYFGGKIDVVVCRLLEIWESMPSFFMLLLVIAVMQSKSIFLVIFVIGIFGWTGFARFIRGEFLKQRNLPYIEACRALGFNTCRIVFSHILPNAIPPILTLLPFAVMSAITSEAGLSFLGLGEEQSCSFGVLMDEGRIAFPGESYLMWPPAIMLTMLLVSIALVGDALRDAFDPRMHQ